MVTIDAQLFGVATFQPTEVGSSSNAELQIDLGNPDKTYAENTYTYSTSAVQPFFHVNTTYLVEADTPISVTLSAYAQADAYDDGGSTVDGAFMAAWVDPYFTIDPDSANADLYQIALSPGVGNEPFAGLPSLGVPEPSTWAMMLLGFARLGFLGYRASRKSGALAA
jgi:hypothetical protein